MNVFNRKTSITLLTLIAATILHGCGDQLTADDNSLAINVQTDSNSNEAQQLLVTMQRVAGRIHYNISTVVTNGCYSKGKVTENHLKNNVLALNAIINYKSGICSQALKKIKFKGKLSLEASDFEKITVNIANARNKTSIKKVISIPK